MQSPSEPQSDFHVLIIGAGIAGLVLAQGLKKNGIQSTVFEAEKSAQDYKPTDWGMGIHWAVPLLKKCLPEDVFADLQSAQVDPFFNSPEADTIPIYNGETGELLKALPLPKVYRVSRRKMRALCVRGIDVQYNKKLISIEAPEGGSSVKATFEDGSNFTGNILVGADGARSFVRGFLLGEQGKAHTVPYVATRMMVKYPNADQARAVRADSHFINSMAVHPQGTWAFISTLDVVDPNDPTTWTFQLMTSWRSDDAEPTTTTLESIRSKMAVFAHPFSSATAWIPEDSNVRVNVNNISTWDPIPFDNHGGRVTIIGDAAHPMTFHRGQGLNHAIADGEALLRALTAAAGTKEQSNGHLPQVEAVSSYDEEVRKRGGDEVRLSKINTEMVHDWNRLMESPLMKISADRGS